MNIKELCKDKFLFFDGAMGTMLLKSGLKAGENPEIYNITHPEVIENIHKQYVEAGAQVITTNTFGANRIKLNKQYSVEEVITSGVTLAKSAGSKYVALDIGPIGQLMAPMGTLSFDHAYDIFAEQVIAGAKAGADLIIIETLSDIYEAKAAILAAKENISRPVICTLSFQKDNRTLTGTDPLTMVSILEGLGVDAIGVNCSLGPNELHPIIDQILKYSHIPVIVQPNAGLPRFERGETVYDLAPQEFAQQVKSMAQKGVKIIGGCCGTTPEYIKAVRELLKGIAPVNVVPKDITYVSSAVKTVIIDHFITVGERINPTGKKRLKEALLNSDNDYVISEAINQKNAGADVLDVNVGVPGIDEAQTMMQCISSIQEVITLPLQIDSNDPLVIEKGARIYNGKPLINSVNGEKKSMNAIFPIVKKYGAAVIGLTLDEGGIPPTAKGRLEIARKIINTALEHGISKENIIIDCLTLPISAEPQSALVTIEALKLIKSELKVKTTLGVSNISYGLPQRDSINKTFLAMALSSGLDVAIINPLSREIMDTIYSYRVLSGQDLDAKKYIETHSNVEVKEVVENKDRDLKQIIIEGLKDEAVLKTKELLKTLLPLQIVEEIIIPSLNYVGQRYEKGEIFLPQLIQSAETVKSAFEILKSELSKDKVDISKGKIILATVKGDIHDIGKNIVKILLENYGYNVMDLGKDVSCEQIIRVAKEENVKLVGLSSLMTTTLKSMEDTIVKLRENGINCAVMVGGAVLSEEYAKAIGADFYGKDAMDGVKIANKVFEKQ